MSNREQYKRAFQALHASRDFSMEAMDMNTKKMRFNFSRGLAVAMIITVLLVGSLSATGKHYDLVTCLRADVQSLIILVLSPPASASEKVLKPESIAVSDIHLGICYG